MSSDALDMMNKQYLSELLKYSPDYYFQRSVNDYISVFTEVFYKRGYGRFCQRINLN